MHENYLLVKPVMVSLHRKCRRFPEAVKVGKDGYLGIDMHPMFVSYINAFKEQQAQIKRSER